MDLMEGKTYSGRPFGVIIEKVKIPGSKARVRQKFLRK